MEIEVSPKRKASFMKSHSIKKYKHMSIEAKQATVNSKNAISSSFNIQLKSEKTLDNLGITQDHFMISNNGKFSLNQLELNYSYLPSIDSEKKQNNEPLSDLEIVYENLKRDIKHLKP